MPIPFMRNRGLIIWLSSGDVTKSELPQGTLDLLILRMVSLGPNHGYAIAQRIQQISCEVLQVRQGSLYPALHRLENKGLLSAEWKETESKARAVLRAAEQVQMGLDAEL